MPSSGGNNMPPKETKYGIGSIIADCILLVEVIIDICTGKLTWFNFLVFILLSIILVALISTLMRRRRKKERERFSTTTSEEEKDIKIAEEE
jgi:membrane protein implicated in regulation of membrane protease activity